jgi:tRNA G18 (ribose-2'-O)-methylase SpoU
LRQKVTGVVGEDFESAFSFSDDDDELDAAKASSHVLQKKVTGSEVGGDTVDTSGTLPKEKNPFGPPFKPGSALDATPLVDFSGLTLEFSNSTEKETPMHTPVTPDAFPPPKARPPGLIVLASLVEKIPNLAGLARTCEVMGAEALVVADSQITKHKDFTAVSVTAERWLPVRTCLIGGMVAYLKRLRKEGYHLVGLEQTRGAVSVEVHEFRKKTVLVLGREREGVDAKVLQMLDQCVVIPQRGMIRSLNVHVSASIAVQRYAAAAARGGW